jgi:hypothetical protein
VVFTTHTHLAPSLKKEYIHTTTPSLGLRDLFYGELQFYHGYHPFHIAEDATVKFLPHKLNRPPCSRHQKHDIKMCEDAVVTTTKYSYQISFKNLFSRSRSETHEQTRPSFNQLCCTIRKEPPLGLLRLSPRNFSRTPSRLPQSRL